MNNKKEVQTFIGVPCSGKSTYVKNNFNPDDIFVISRDDVRNELIKNTEYVYSDLFKRPSEGDIPNSKFGEILPNGQWSKVLDLNNQVNSLFNARILEAAQELSNGKTVIVDLVNMKYKARQDVKKWFKDIENVEYNATVFDFSNNLSLIEKQLEVRGVEENKFIPFFVVKAMIDDYDPIESSEFSNIKHIDGLIGLKNKTEQNFKSVSNDIIKNKI